MRRSKEAAAAAEQQRTGREKERGLRKRRGDGGILVPEAERLGEG